MVLLNDEPLTIEEKLQMQIDQLESIINDLDDITNTSEYRFASSVSSATRYLIEGRTALIRLLDAPDAVSAEKGTVSRV